MRNIFHKNFKYILKTAIMHLNTRRYRHHRTARKYDKTSHRKFSKKKPAFTIVTDRKKHRFGRIKNGDNYFALSTSDYDGGHKLWKFNRLVMTSLLQIRFGAAVFNFRNRRDFRVFLGFRVSFAFFFAAAELSQGKIKFTDSPTGLGANLWLSLYI